MARAGARAPATHTPLTQNRKVRKIEDGSHSRLAILRFTRRVKYCKITRSSFIPNGSVEIFSPDRNQVLNRGRVSDAESLQKTSWLDRSIQVIYIPSSTIIYLLIRCPCRSDRSFRLLRVAFFRLLESQYDTRLIV